MVNFVLILLFWVSSTYAQVECRKNDKAWQPYNTNTSKFIGLNAYGYNDEALCSTSIKQAPTYGVCNWNGKGWASYFLNGKPLGSDTVHYDKVEECNEYISDQHNDLLCLWNGYNFQPYGVTKKSFIGLNLYGLRTKNECLKEIKSADENYVCNWSGGGYSVYSKSEPGIKTINTTFKEAEYCHEFISKLKNNKLISIDGQESKVRSPFKSITTDIGYTLAHCHDSSKSYHNVKRGADNKILSSCIPDTLYSWGDFGKLFWFQKKYQEPGNWGDALPRPFYLTPSPIGTHGYGPVSIRMKLKADVVGRLTTEDQKRLKCEDLSKTEIKSSIIINQWNNGFGTGTDYILCSMGPVESWSYATEEHYDEILREWEWIEKNDYKNYELYYKIKGVDQLWDLTLDNNLHSKSTLTAHLLIFQQLNGAGIGGVFVQDRRTSEEDHFKTRYPIYFNPD